MSGYDYDLFVIGAGSGGVRASRVSASYGARVAIAEDRPLGGTCLNVGCIPKKLFVYASHFGDAFEDAEGYGWSVGERRFDWQRLLQAKNREIARLNGVYRRLLDEAGVTLYEGRARLVGPHSIEVDGKRYSAESILVATGSWPRIPDVPGAELGLSSNEMFQLEQLPERAVVIGGGYIGVEFAGILHGLGVQVTQLYRGPLFLRGFDDDLRQGLAEEMRGRGIRLEFDADVERLDRSASGIAVRCRNGNRFEADLVLFATGRQPLSRGLGLEEAGVELGEGGEIRVDRFSCSSVPHIWAIGDVTDRVQLTPVAIHEGMCLARTLFRDEPTPVDHENVASAVFSQPPIATVGLSEAEAREAGHAVDIYRSSFRPLLHTLSGRQERAVLKLVVDAESDRVLGCHMLGPEAAEIIQGFAAAMKGGATKAQLDATMAIHPTSAEEFVTMREKA